MNRAKLVIIIEAVIIIILAVFLILTIYSSYTSSVTGKVAYCDRHFYDSQVCLLSPRIYTGVLESQNLLTLNFKPLQNDIQSYISMNNLNVSVYVLNLRDSASFGIHSNTGFQPASLNKLPVAILIMEKVESGELTLDTVLPIGNEDRDSESGTLYNSTVYSMSVMDLLYYMLSQSDNTALKVLESQVTLEDLYKLSIYLNYYTQDVDYTPPINNTYLITPKSTGNLFISLYLSTVLKPEDSELILKLLTNTAFDIKKYASLPNDTIVAEKYGAYYLNNESFFHDCGIIYIQDSRIFYCIMTKDIQEQQASVVVGTIVNKVYNYVIEQENSTISND